ncbi:MAG: phosphoribosylglycinamide formyltransferase [Pseudomonadota bacterium]
MRDRPKKRVAVLISGGGTNLQSLIDASLADDYPAEIVLVISNKADAYGLERAKAAGIATAIIDHKAFSSREAFEDSVHATLTEARVDIICLAGFMRRLTASFVARWPNRILNIHPSLLPAFPGLDVHQRAIDAGARFSGCTVHLVNAELDAGPIILQAAVPIAQDDTAETLAARILTSEHVIYPQALAWIAGGKARLEGGRLIIDELGSLPQAVIWPSA